MTSSLTIGERVAWYRRRRGMSQPVLASIIGRTDNWLGKVENNRISLDRLSVIRAISDALDVSLGDLLGEPSLMEPMSGSGRRIPALRSALMNYRQLTPLLADDDESEPQPLHELRGQVGQLWEAYQASRFGYVTHVLPLLLADTHRAVNAYQNGERDEALNLAALAYQVAASTLTKVGEIDLAWMASDRGLIAAQEANNPVMVCSLLRTVVHALQSNGRYDEAADLTDRAGVQIGAGLDQSDPRALSVYGTLFLAGSMAAARAEDRSTTRSFLSQAQRAATRLGGDANHLWTAFGLTNVAIHHVNTAMELGDVQVAVDLAPNIDTTTLPLERRVRHALEVARIYNATNRLDDAVTTLLDVEQEAPEQVRYHFISRQLVIGWIRNTRGKPSHHLAGLAQRLYVA